MRSNSWMPFLGTNGRSGGFGYLDPQGIIEHTLREIPIRTTAIAPAARAVQRALPADVIETEHALVITLDMPGHDPAGMDLNIENQVLTIRSERSAPEAEEGRQVHRAERGYGVFTRSFLVPQTVDAEGIEAGYEQGVLKITMPKREEAKPRTIEVDVDS